MDKQKFDNLTRLFGSGLNRRQVMRGLVGGAGALAGMSALRPDSIGAQNCAAPGANCQNNPGQGNNCCSGTCDDEGPGNGTCSDCADGEYYCAATGCIATGECCSSTDPCCGSTDPCCGSNDLCCGSTDPCCGDPDPCCGSTDECCPACTEECTSCVSGECVQYAEYCPETQQCYNTGTGGCCTDSECGDGSCVNGECQAEHCDPNDNTITCPPGSFHAGLSKKPAGGCCNGNGNCCSNICSEGFCVGEQPECEDSSDCDACEVCDSGTCIPLICEPGETCVNGECQPDHCDPNADTITCPPGSFHAGLTKKPDGGCCNGNGNCCSNNCVNGICVGNCPQGELYCERTQSCYNPAFECCYDDNCEGCAVCNNANMCSDPECCYDADCPDCYTCSVEEGVCVESLCFIGYECCHDQCVPNGECCKGVGEYCGVLEVTTSWFGSPQVDCCDGLVCCEHKSHGATCAECCNDWDCPQGAYCHEGWCAYPDKECHHDKNCPHGTCCCKDGSCSGQCCNHPHPPKPPAPPKPVPPASGGTVSSMPATGAGPSDQKNNFFGVAALGAAAALFAKKLRETPGEAPSQD